MSRWTIPCSWALLESEHDLLDDAQRHRQVGRSALREMVAQVPPIYELQHHVALAVELAELMDMDNVRMVELGDGVRLGLETQERGGIGGQVGSKELERHLGA